MLEAYVMYCYAHPIIIYTYSYHWTVYMKLVLNS